MSAHKISLTVRREVRKTERDLLLLSGPLGPPALGHKGLEDLSHV